MARAILIAAEKGLRLPIVYNTNSYDSVEVLKLLDGIVDVYLPDGVRPQVAEGQTAIAGETVIADLRAGVKELTFRVG